MKQKKLFTDQEISAMIREKKNQNLALNQLYMQYYEIMTHYVIKNSGSEADAADIIQEVMLVFVRLIEEGKFRGEASIKTYLYSILKNLWISEIRKRKATSQRHEKYQSQSNRWESDISETLSQQENIHFVMKLFSQLGEACKTILTLFYYEDLPLKEICVKLEFSSEQVLRNKKYKCLKALTDSVTNSPEISSNLKKALRHE
ncbi:sigma-70 family RNA polymerase sigma factor [Algoriphagus sp.]|uniref:RNA polymerase sigma factor n=1 Tax=Algoriphagus sp. TaxID=1872435 RepID=UPI002618C661|nr:sigma-70 family RNA polymerase sigma factor [Algoriphagus sp.]